MGRVSGETFQENAVKSPKPLSGGENNATLYCIVLDMTGMIGYKACNKNKRYGRVAQLDRVLASEARSRGFESRLVHHE